MIMVNKKTTLIAELWWAPNTRKQDVLPRPPHPYFMPCYIKGTLPPALALNVGIWRKLWGGILYNMDIILRDTRLFIFFSSCPSWYLCDVQDWPTTWEIGKERTSTKTGRGELLSLISQHHNECEQYPRCLGGHLLMCPTFWHNWIYDQRRVCYWVITCCSL